MGTLAFAQPATSPKTTRGVSVSVLQGDGVVHSLPKPLASHISIRVTDTDNHPIQGAVAVFELPLDGPTATLPDEAAVKVILTDKDGAAAVSILPNDIPGHFEPKITVNYMGQTTSLSLKQENAFAPAVRPDVYRHSLLHTSTSRKATSGISRKTAVILLTVVAAVATGAIVATRGGSTPTPTPTTPTPGGGGIVITPGPGTVGGN